MDAFANLLETSVPKKKDFITLKPEVSSLPSKSKFKQLNVLKVPQHSVYYHSV
jgi:hypothetical protein